MDHHGSLWIITAAMAAVTKRRRIDGAATTGILPVAVAGGGGGDDQQPAPLAAEEARPLINADDLLLTSDRYLPAWLSVFRSGGGDAKSLGRLAVRTSRTLTQLLESAEGSGGGEGGGSDGEIWNILCRQQLGGNVYNAVPPAIRESMGPRRLLAQMAPGPSMRYTTQDESTVALPEPTLTADNTTFLVNVWKGDRVIISQAVTGEELSELFDEDFVPDMHTECKYHNYCGDEDGEEERYFESSGNKHPVDIMVKLDKPILLGGADLSDCKATVQLLYTIGGQKPKCTPLLQYPSEGFISDVVCECSYYEETDFDVNGNICSGEWVRNGIAVSHHGETFLDLDGDGEAILNRVCSEDVSIINGLRLSLNFVYFRPFQEDENGDFKEEGYLTHFTIRFHAERKEGRWCTNSQCGQPIESYCYAHDSPPDVFDTPDPRIEWKESGVTIPHLLPHIKGVKTNMPKKPVAKKSAMTK